MSGVSPVTDNTKIINQLRALVLLTQTEEQIARTRVSQARTDAVRRELNQNADHAAERALEITEQLRALGGVPDVVTPAIGRNSANPWRVHRKVPACVHDRNSFRLEPNGTSEAWMRAAIQRRES